MERESPFKVDGNGGADNGIYTEMGRFRAKKMAQGFRSVPFYMDAGDNVPSARRVQREP